MEFRDYQLAAAETDQVTEDDEKSKLVPMLGLAGEVGTLLSEYKKYLRDGGAHQRFEEEVAEDLGDLLWYIANVATKFGLDLSDISKANLEKVNKRWPSRQTHVERGSRGKAQSLDASYPPDEQLPREFEIEFSELCDGDSARVLVRRNGIKIGDELTDNAHNDDGYRFHDVFHLAYAAVLGWSPVVRKLLGVKRKSEETTHEVEDGARARIIEELISQLVFRYASDHDFLQGIKTLDYHLLKTIKSLVSDREVNVRALYEWENAILAGYRVWRKVYDQRGGTVKVDLNQRSIEVIDMPNMPEKD